MVARMCGSRWEDSCGGRSLAEVGEGGVRTPLGRGVDAEDGGGVGCGVEVWCGVETVVEVTGCVVGSG